MKKFIAILLAGVFTLSAACPAFAEEELTKGEYADLLLNIASDYNPGITRESLIKGDNGGSNDENAKPVTKAEALVMLKRAFGSLPKLQGDLQRTAPKAGTYTDVPLWAVNEISALSNAGVLSEEAGGALGANQHITKAYADTMAGRMYRLYGSSPKDDFYTYVNKGFLTSSVIKSGYSSTSIYNDITNQIGYDLADILVDILKKHHSKGSIEQKIKDFYLTAADVRTRQELGIKPIREYLFKLRQVKSDKELQEFALSLADDTTLDVLFGFSVTTELEDKNSYIPVFDTYVTTLPLDAYTQNGEAIKAYREYLIKILTLGGNDNAAAEKKADDVIAFEMELAKHTKATEEYSQIESSYNYYSLNQLQRYYKSVDLKSAADVHGFKLGSKIVVADPDAMMFYGSYFDGKHTETLKNLAEVSMLAFYSDLLTEDFVKADNMLVEAVYGYNPQNDMSSNAFNTTVNMMSDYLGMVYYQNNFTDKEKKQVENIAQSVIACYRDRLNANTWLSDATKAQAIKKLDNMKVVVGMPEESSSFMDNIPIKGVSSKVKGEKQSAYIDNIYAVLKENDRITADLLNGECTVEDISFSAYTVNAMYMPSYNTMVLPAGILRKPIFDVNNSYEENYGAIGYIIGHEISHAFDTNGAKYDEKGNYKNWWTEADYAKFEELSKKAQLYYDGAEAATGLTVNGKLTLDENIADIAGVEVALDALARNVQQPDYKKFFESLAKTSRYTTTRDSLEVDLQEDEHSPNYIRVNYAVKSTDEFYDAYNVTADDGMYVPEADRIRIW